MLLKILTSCKDEDKKRLLSLIKEIDNNRVISALKNISRKDILIAMKGVSPNIKDCFLSILIELSNTGPIKLSQVKKVHNQIINEINIKIK